MRILQVVTIEASVKAFLIPHIKALEAAGHTVEVACRLDPGNSVLAGHGITAHSIDFERRPLRWSNVVAFRQLVRLIRAGQYDIVHGHMPTGGALARLAAAVCKTPVAMYTAHGFYFHAHTGAISDAVYYLVERSLARLSTAIITMNEADYRSARRWARKGGRPAVYRVSGVGIEVDKFRRANVFPSESERRAFREGLGIANDDLVIGTVGSCSPRKRHGDLLQATARALPRLPELKIVVVGDGPLLERERGLARELGLGDRCLFLGRRDDIPHLLSAMDVYVQASMMEGLPVSVMEAMANGLPILVSDVQGNRDLVTHGEHGFVYPLSDTEALCRYVVRLGTDANLRSSLGERAALRAARYDQARVCREQLDIYDELIEQAQA